MANYTFKATELIAEELTKNDVKYQVVLDEAGSTYMERIIVGFIIRDGHNVYLQYIIDEGNDIAARLQGLVSASSSDKQQRLLKACNIVNKKIRHLKFCLNSEGSVDVEYDFPSNLSDECVGKVALEIMVRSIKILDKEFSLFIKAMYTDDTIEDEEERNMKELLKQLVELRDDSEDDNSSEEDFASEEESEMDDTRDTILEFLEETFNSDEIKSSEED